MFTGAPGYHNLMHVIIINKITMFQTKNRFCDFPLYAVVEGNKGIFDFSTRDTPISNSITESGYPVPGVSGYPGTS